MSVNPKVLRDWFGIVAGYVSPSFPADAMEALLRLEPALRNYPTAAFTAASAEAVATTKRFGPVPDLGTVITALREYLRDFGPAAPRLQTQPEPDWQPPTEAEQQRVGTLLARHFAERAANRAPLQPGKPLPDVALRGDALAGARLMQERSE